jgi:outer membrane immunogenic protein
LAAAATNQLGSHRTDGFIGGGQFGYNWQFSSIWLAGFEADIQGSSASGTATTTNAVLTNTTSGINTATWNTATSISDRLDYLGTVRGRIGVIATPTFLAYGTGGFAYGGVKSSTSMAINATFLNGTPVGGVPPGLATGSFSDTRTGWTAGGGVEWMFLPSWTAKLEYLHYDLGSETYGTGGYSVNVGPTSLPSIGFATIATSTTVHFKCDIVRVGLNYLFH